MKTLVLIQQTCCHMSIRPSPLCLLPLFLPSLFPLYLPHCSCSALKSAHCPWRGMDKSRQIQINQAAGTWTHHWCTGPFMGFNGLWQALSHRFSDKLLDSGWGFLNSRSCHTAESHDPNDQSAFWWQSFQQGSFQTSRTDYIITVSSFTKHEFSNTVWLPESNDRDDAGTCVSDTFKS